MKTAFALLAQYEKAVLNLNDLGDLFGLAPKTVQNQIYQGVFGVKTFKMGTKDMAHVEDVATYIDAQRGKTAA